MKRIILIQPYFGNFSNYFALHLKSIRCNPEINWLFFTDNPEGYDWPPNVRVYTWEFSKLRNLVQSKFDFKIALDKPYKLCDFKPAYGYIFQEYLTGCNFWGHCDLDMIWGDIGAFLKGDILQNYEFIYREGAFRLYKNCEEINNLFRKSGTVFCYREVFSAPESYGFDEALSIQRIAEKNNILIYHDDNAVADIGAFEKPLYIRNVKPKRWKNQAGVFRSVTNYPHQIFKWQNGKMLRCYWADGQIKEDEFMYIHLLKRKMSVHLTHRDAESFLITPDAFSDDEELNEERLKSLAMADMGKAAKSVIFAVILRKLRSGRALTGKQRRVVLRKRFYFVLEKFQSLRHDKEG